MRNALVGVLVAGTVAAQEPALPYCPGLDYYAPELVALSVPELERRVATLPYLMPSQAKNQLRTLQASTLSYREDKRSCVYRMGLIASVASIPAVFASSPSLFGHTTTSAQLRSWFLEMPLREKWTTDQRASVLKQIDELFLPNLKVDIPEDAEFWKRMYYGIALTCEATELTLEKIKARRNTDCLGLKPK